ncbi:MAG: aminotransferase class V-fold PLP-dependent enzyme [Chloroflexi bacterium]|nr:aminotransferase class V-fold PLP-dependent enzyme [Chloroflexota bacterium]
MRRLNVSAGQTTLSSGARAILGRQMDAPIYYPDYYRAELDAAAHLQDLMGTRSEVLILTGNATHAIEATMVSLLEPGQEIITINGGIFGQVFTEVAALTGAIPVEIRVPYGSALDLDLLERVLRKHPRAAAVGVVHVETSTGVLQPLEELADLVRPFGMLLIVDAVSSLGATQLFADRWGIDVCLSSGQKALNAPQGLAIVSTSDRAWKAIEQRQTPIGSLCLDLRTWRDYREWDVSASLKAWQGSGRLRQPARRAVHGPSPSGPLVYGLLGALQDIAAEGKERVFQRHRVASKAVRLGLRGLGLRVLADEPIAAPSVTTALLPDGIDEFELRRKVYQEHGIALGAGPVEIGLNAFRVGTMGCAAHPVFQMPVMEALGKALYEMGCGCRPEAGAEAAKAIFDEAGDLFAQVGCDARD